MPASPKARTITFSEFQAGMDCRPGLFAADSRRFRELTNLLVSAGRSLIRRPPTTLLSGTLDARYQGWLSHNNKFYTIRPKTSTWGGSDPGYSAPSLSGVTTQVLQFDMPPYALGTWTLLSFVFVGDVAVAWIRHAMYGGFNRTFLHIFDDAQYTDDVYTSQIPFAPYSPLRLPTFVYDPYLPADWSTGTWPLGRDDGAEQGILKTDSSPVLHVAVSKLWSSEADGDIACSAIERPRVWDQRSVAAINIQGEMFYFTSSIGGGLVTWDVPRGTGWHTGPLNWLTPSSAIAGIGIPSRSYCDYRLQRFNTTTDLWEDVAEEEAAFWTSLSGALGAFDTTVSISAVPSSSVPTEGYAQINDEIIIYTGKTVVGPSATALTGCIRGAFGTPPVALASGTVVGLGAVNVAVVTTTSGPVTSTATVIPVTSSASFPVSGTAYLGTEIISYTGKTASPDTLTGCTRGTQGTSGVLHASGTVVVRFLDWTTEAFIISGTNPAWSTQNWTKLIAFSPLGTAQSLYRFRHILTPYSVVDGGELSPNPQDTQGPLAADTFYYDTAFYYHAMVSVPMGGHLIQFQRPAAAVHDLTEGVHYNLVRSPVAEHLARVQFLGVLPADPGPGDVAGYPTTGDYFTVWNPASAAGSPPTNLNYVVGPGRIILDGKTVTTWPVQRSELAEFATSYVLGMGTEQALVATIGSDQTYVRGGLAGNPGVYRYHTMFDVSTSYSAVVKSDTYLYGASAPASAWYIEHVAQQAVGTSGVGCSGAGEAAEFDTSKQELRGEQVTTFVSLKDRLAVVYPSTTILWQADADPTAMAYLDQFQYGSAWPAAPLVYNQAFLASAPSFRRFDLYGLQFNGVDETNIGEMIQDLGVLSAVHDAVFWPEASAYVAVVTLTGTQKYALRAALAGSLFDTASPVFGFLFFTIQRPSNVAAWSFVPVSQLAVPGTTPTAYLNAYVANSLVAVGRRLYFRVRRLIVPATSPPTRDAVAYFDLDGTVWRDQAGLTEYGASIGTLPPLIGGTARWYYNTLDRPTIGKRFLALYTSMFGKATFDLSVVPQSGALAAGPTLVGTSYGGARIPLAMTGIALAPGLTLDHADDWSLQSVSVDLLWLGR